MDSSPTFSSLVDAQSTCVDTSSQKSSDAAGCNRCRFIVAAGLCVCAALLGTIAVLHSDNEHHDEEDAPLVSHRHLAHRFLADLVPSASSSLITEEEKLPALFPFDAKDYVGFSTAFIALCLAATTGMGGGGLLIPTYILLLDFPVKHAIPLTSVTVFGGSIANNIMNYRKCHPLHPTRGCIDWDFIVMMEPPTIAGAIVGVLLNDYLPDVVLIVMLLVLLSLTALKALEKANKLHDKETRQKLLEEQTRKNTESQTLVSDTSGDSDESNLNANGYGSIENQQTDFKLQRQETSFASEKQHRLWLDIAKLVGLFTCVTVINIWKGGPGEGGEGPLAGVHCGVGCFWISQVIILVLCAVFVMWCRSELLDRLDEGGPVLSDIAWDRDNTKLYPTLAIMAGLVAGLFGVGGGLVKGPLMIALDVHPAVASATSACMIFFTSSTSTIGYMVFGLITFDYAVFCFFLGVVATFCGQTVTTVMMERQRHQRHSYIAYMIAFVVAISAAAMTFESVIAVFF